MSEYTFFKQKIKDETDNIKEFEALKKDIYQDAKNWKDSYNKLKEEEEKVLTVKGKDYTQGKGRYKNFYDLANELNIDAKKILWVYFKKHIDAILSYILHGQVESEPILLRIVDARNYLALLWGLIENERGRDEKNNRKNIK